MNQGQLNELTKRLDMLIERYNIMTDEQYMAIRSYLEEQSSLLRQVLDKLNAHVAADVSPSEAKAAAAPTPQLPKEAVGPATEQTVMPKRSK